MLLEQHDCFEILTSVMSAHFTSCSYLCCLNTFTYNCIPLTWQE